MNKKTIITILLALMSMAIPVLGLAIVLPCNVPSSRKTV